MSSTVYANQNPSPAVTRRTPMTIENTGNNSQPNENRRSLSNKLRNLFRRSSPSPNRTTTNDRNLPTTSVRQTSASPISGKSSSEVPHLRAPMVKWPLGKKKTKPAPIASTPTTSKKKIKANRKTNPTSTPAMEISSPIYQQENQTSIQGEYFTSRTPERAYDSTERIQSSSSYEVTTTKGFRDYVIIDQSQQSQQVVVPDTDVFTPSIYTSDHSLPSSMNRQRLPNTNIEHHYYQNNLTPTGSIPIADIEVIPTPQRKRKVGDTPPSNNNRILVEKPPIIPQTSSRASSTIQPTNGTQWKSTTSSTLNTSGAHSTTSLSMDPDAPKLNAPSISFGTSSKKKKSKRTSSQNRLDGMTSSTSTINNLVHQNPTKPDRSWPKTYGSLPDAEVYYSGSLTPSKQSKSKPGKYPGLSAIVHYHQRSARTYVNEYPFTTTTTTTTTPAVSPQRPPRFDTSTTTLNEYEQNQPWPPPPSIKKDSSISKSGGHHHDGYIRPMTPEDPDINTIHINIKAIPGRSPSPRSPRYDSPTSPTTYRSSATIYTQDKHRYVNGGEIRTWSSHDTNINKDYDDLYKKPPYAHVQIDYRHEPKTNGYEQQIVPPKTRETYDEYRYSPRAHEQEYIKKEQQIINDEENQEEEERYEISYEYERQDEHYSYGTRTHYDELHTANRYSNENDGDQNLNYSKLSSVTRSAHINERETIYDHSSRSYIDSEHTQEPLETVAPVNSSRETARTYTLKRSNSYDGLGISVGANADTRLNHIIRDVEPGSPGDRAGLRKNDRIISVNGINVENVDFSNVLLLIKQGLEDNNIQLSVIHESEYN